MKKYIKPNIKVKNVETEPLLAAMSVTDQVSGSSQLSKGYYGLLDDEDETSVPVVSKVSLWDDDDDI